MQKEWLLVIGMMTQLLVGKFPRSTSNAAGAKAARQKTWWAQSYMSMGTILDNITRLLELIAIRHKSPDRTTWPSRLVLDSLGTTIYIYLY